MGIRYTNGRSRATADRVDSPRVLAFQVLTCLAIQILFSVNAFAQSPIHLWTFNTDARDKIGNAHGNLVGAAIAGGVVVFDGVNDYVELPIGGTISNLNDSAFLVWATWGSSQAPAPSIFDFGDNVSAYMALTPNDHSSSTAGFTIINPSSTQHQLIDLNPFPPGPRICVVVVIDDSTLTGKLFANSGLPPISGPVLVPSSLGSTSNNWLGRSRFPQDPYFEGSIDEFRIYDTTLTDSQMEAICKAGPNSIFSDGFESGDTSAWFAVQ